MFFYSVLPFIHKVIHFKATKFICKNNIIKEKYSLTTLTIKALPQLTVLYAQPALNHFPREIDVLQRKRGKIPP
ncbi:hypothetical protein ACRTC3_21620, partial [Photobacterium damselae]|uniref:hypothetical protein n=1 Tax=Photobacterium damselae TaxID=38293 RepID=UPI003D7E3FD7